MLRRPLLAVRGVSGGQTFPLAPPLAALSGGGLMGRQDPECPTCFMCGGTGPDHE